MQTGEKLCREKGTSITDVNSPFVDDDYDSDQHLLEKDKQYDIPKPEADDNEIRHPDIDDPVQLRKTKATISRLKNRR